MCSDALKQDIQTALGTLHQCRQPTTQGISQKASEAHHRTTCGALQRDHFVLSPDSPYWPQDEAAPSASDLGMSRLHSAHQHCHLLNRF